MLSRSSRPETPQARVSMGSGPLFGSDESPTGRARSVLHDSHHSVQRGCDPGGTTCHPAETIPVLRGLLGRQSSGGYMTAITGN